MQQRCVWDMKYNGIEWVAGILEGEGYFGMTKASHHKNYTQCFIKIQMTDEDILEKVAEVLGGKVAKLNMDIPSRKNRKQVYAWGIQSQEAVYDTLLRVRPYMGSRRKAKIDEMLAYLNTTSHVKELLE